MEFRRLPTTPVETAVKSVLALFFQMTITVVLLCVFIMLSVDTKPIEDPVCGYKSCPNYDPDALNIHIIPHSHDDVGWLKTVDQYYFQDVLNTLSSVILALKKNPERKYVQVETAFFKKWWREQSDATKEEVIGLVNRGQLEFIGGAWSMNDEASVHYQTTIDQFTLGLRYLEDNIGQCARPRVGWQIDPFGHSREHASLSAQMGFDSLFFARLDYRDRDNRKAEKTMDLLWRGSANLGNNSDIFTSVFHDHYSAPGGFCFDIVCADEPIIDDEDSPDYNYEQRVEDFATTMKDWANHYPTNNILVTMGDDFRYEGAINTYINLDRLIKGFDLFPQNFQGIPIKVYYSTPSCYAKAVNEFSKTQNYTIQVKTDDFFPYADGKDTYWTGYFTSRPASKGFERKGNNLLQVVKQLAAIGKESYENPKLNSLKESMGIMQHHDAITGTEKQHVADNYHLMLSSALVGASELSSSILSGLIAEGEDFEFKSCLLANISYCPSSQTNKFTVAIYNPLARTVSSPLSLPVNSESWRILAPDNQEVNYQISEPLNDYSFTGFPVAPFNLEFVAKDLPALGYKIYRFEALESKNSPKPEASASYGYEDVSFEIDDSGLLSSVTMNGLTRSISQDFLYYFSSDSSGAYIFAPDKNVDIRRAAAGDIKTTPISGDVYQGVQQEFLGWIKQTIKVYNDDRSFIEFDWTIGPIDVETLGKEIVTRYTSDLKSLDYFYTDAMGRELLNRTKNYRPDYDYTNEEPVSGNYYPVNSKILIRDGEAELAILTDRTEGGTSLNEGQIEVMVHRACHHDDYRGVGEILNEREYGRGLIVRGKHFLILGEPKSVSAVERDVAQRKHLSPWPFITNQEVEGALERSFIKQPLPSNVHLLSLEPWHDDTLLLRLEHFLEKNEDESEVTIDLSDFLTTTSISELQETTLGANQLLEEDERFDWPNSAVEQPEVLSYEYRMKRDLDDLNIELAPMQIRTFLAKISDE